MEPSTLTDLSAYLCSDRLLYLNIGAQANIR